MNPVTSDRVMASLYKHLADSIENMTDEQLLLEAFERGEDPEDTRIKLQARLRKYAGFKEQ
jgi:hypothetical protein